MYRKLIIAATVLTAAAIACATPGAGAPTEGITEAPTNAQAPTAEVIVVTATPLPATSGPVLVATATPISPTAAAAKPPSFSHSIVFAETPDIAAQVREFHGGVTRIYAMWEYFNMTEGLIVRRDWYREGALWITKTDAWDMSKYGANGSVYDISIYDTDDGLPSGHYELQLFIDDVPQFAPNDDNSLRSFDIAQPADGGQ